MVVGLIHHYMGYWLGLQQLFCEQRTGLIHLDPPPLYEVILEGVAFVVFGNLLSWGIHSRGVLFFVLGCVLHLLSEAVGIHRSFLKRCF
jgi:hypothetical protein